MSKSNQLIFARCALFLLLGSACADESGPLGPQLSEDPTRDDGRPITHPEEPLEVDEDGGPSPPKPSSGSRDDAATSLDAGGRDPNERSEYDVASICSSETFWTSGYSTEMRPGEACVSCHAGNGRAPKFQVAGTVYPTAHEPDHCHADNAVPVRVEITGADGRVLQLDVNKVGNFMSQSALALPYRARVIAGGRVREMRTPQHSGDCNACHTQQGAASAPGRVLLP